MFHYCCASQYGFAEATIRSLGLNSKIVDPMEALYADTCSCVNVDGVMDWFTVDSGVRQGGRSAPDLFLGPMDHDGAHRPPGMTGVTLEDEIFTDLDFADDVALLTEMLEVLVLVLSVMEEAAAFGVQSTGIKLKLSSSAIQPHVQQSRWQMDRLKWSTPSSISGA